MMRIGITGHGFIGWMGGIDFLRTIIDSLFVASPDVEIHFLIPNAGVRYQARSQLQRFKRALFKVAAGGGGHVAPSSAIIDEFVAGFGGRLLAHRIDIGEAALRQASIKYQLDVLLPLSMPLKKQVVPWIGYLPDYQHKYFPNFFSKKEVEARNRHYERMLAVADHVIVNARAVANDIEQFNPVRRSKIVVLPFSAAPNPMWFDLEVADFEKYGITKPYFIVCNQFWRHKDHATTWHALALLSQQYPEVQLVCTGATSDYRNPGYFGDLMRLAEELGISSKLKVLGLISKHEQIQLIRDSVALVQPSLFEGGPGGGAVFDAVSLGVPCIVSDIPVNRELNQSSVRFFDAGNPVSLSEAMELALRQSQFVERPNPAELVRLGVERRRYCGLMLLDVIGSSLACRG